MTAARLLGAAAHVVGGFLIATGQAAPKVGEAINDVLTEVGWPIRQVGNELFEPNDEAVR